MYKGRRFVYRSVKDIKADIDTVKAMSDELTAVSWKMGQCGRITRDVGVAVLQANPYLNDNYCFVTVFNWLYSGGKTAFFRMPIA